MCERPASSSTHSRSGWEQRQRSVAEAPKGHNRRDKDIQKPSLMEQSSKEEERGNRLVLPLVDCFSELQTLLCEENIKSALHRND